MRTSLRIAGLLLAFVGATTAADDAYHSLWVVKGKSNSVVLLGSVHMLKPDASELPAEALQAYEHAAALVMELDLGSVSTEDMVLAMSTAGALSGRLHCLGSRKPTIFSSVCSGWPLTIRFSASSKLSPRNADPRRLINVVLLAPMPP